MEAPENPHRRNQLHLNVKGCGCKSWNHDSGILYSPCFLICFVALGLQQCTKDYQTFASPKHRASWLFLSFPFPHLGPQDAEILITVSWDQWWVPGFETMSWLDILLLTKDQQKGGDQIPYVVIRVAWIHLRIWDNWATCQFQQIKCIGGPCMYM